jgi:hypothetical protein
MSATRLLVASAMTLVGAALGSVLFPRLSPQELRAEGCGPNNGKLCQKTCTGQGCGGCCSWSYSYYSLT